MHEREDDERIADMLAEAEEAGETEAGLIEVDAMDLVRVLQEVEDRRADERLEASRVNALYDGLVGWAGSEEAAKAHFRAWLAAMDSQHRDVSRHEAKWEIIEPQDQLLHARISQLFITAAIEAVHNGEEVARHGTGREGAV